MTLLSARNREKKSHLGFFAFKIEKDNLEIVEWFSQCSLFILNWS